MDEIEIEVFNVDFLLYGPTFCLCWEFFNDFFIGKASVIDWKPAFLIFIRVPINHLTLLRKVRFRNATFKQIVKFFCSQLKKIVKHFAIEECPTCMVSFLKFCENFQADYYFIDLTFCYSFIQNTFLFILPWNDLKKDKDVFWVIFLEFLKFFKQFIARTTEKFLIEISFK